LVLGLIGAIVRHWLGSAGTLLVFCR